MYNLLLLDDRRPTDFPILEELKTLTTLMNTLAVIE